MSEVFVGDVGTEIVLECGVPITTATVMRIYVRKPTGTAVWSAVADTSTSIKYVTGIGDLDVAGEYRLQAYVEMPGWKGRGSVARLTVSNAI